MVGLGSVSDYVTKNASTNVASRHADSDRPLSTGEEGPEGRSPVEAVSAHACDRSCILPLIVAPCSACPTPQVVHKMQQ